MADDPQRRQAIQKACRPDNKKKERDTFFNTKRNMHARLEAPEVDFAAPLAAFDHSHQRLWLVACHVLRQRQDIDA